MIVDIYTITNALSHSVAIDDDSFRYRALCDESYVQLVFTTPQHVEIDLLSYIEVNGERYYLLSPAEITSQNTRNYAYKARFESRASLLKLYRFKNHVDGKLNTTITATPAEHLQMIIDSVNASDDILSWAMGTCIVAAEKTINYNYLTCLEALQLLAAEFNTEWSVDGNKVSLGKVVHDVEEPISLAYGRGKGFLPGVGRTMFGTAYPCTHLYVQGGERNIDPSKYGSKTLLLPPSRPILNYDGTYFSDEIGYDASKGVSYVAWTRDMVRRVNIRRVDYHSEGVLDCTEIYPHRVGTVTDVIIRGNANIAYNYFDIVDSNIPWELNYSNYEIVGQPMTIVFQSGNLAGREFGVKYHHHFGSVSDPGGHFEIIPQEYDGVLMPSVDYAPAVGDKYAVFNIALPDSYIANDSDKSGASWDMFRKAVRYLHEQEVDKYTFTGKLDRKYIRDNNLYDKLRVGEYVSFTNEGFQPEAALLRIGEVKDSLTTPEDVEITLTQRPVPRTSKLQAIVTDSKINASIEQVAASSVRESKDVRAQILSTTLFPSQLKTINGESIIISDYGDTNIEIAGGGGTTPLVKISSTDEAYIVVESELQNEFTITPKVLSIDDYGTGPDESLNFGLATTEDVITHLEPIWDRVENGTSNLYTKMVEIASGCIYDRSGDIEYALPSASEEFKDNADYIIATTDYVDNKSSDVYIADFRLPYLQDTENDTPIDFMALWHAIQDYKVVLVRNGDGGFCVVSNVTAQQGISIGTTRIPARVTFTINNGIEVYSATAKGGDINAIKASDKSVKTLVTEDTIGDINTLLETIIAG